MTFAWWHVLLALIPICPNLWGIFHIWSHDFNDDMTRKAIWLVLCTFIPVLGGVIYFFAGKKHAGNKIKRAVPGA